MKMTLIRGRKKERKLQAGKTLASSGGYQHAGDQNVNLTSDAPKISAWFGNLFSVEKVEVGRNKIGKIHFTISFLGISPP